MALPKYFIFILFLIYGCQCFAQQDNNGLLPLVKPCYKIDSVLIFLSNGYYSKIPKGLFLEVDIGILTSDNSILITISEFSKTALNNTMIRSYKEGKYLGYFEFRNATAFLSSSIKDSSLFTETRKIERFKFLDFSSQIEASKLTQNPPENMVDNIILPAMFQYKNGKITSWDYGEQR
jgi:hypothetical protein